MARFSNVYGARINRRNERSFVQSTAKRINRRTASGTKCAARVGGDISEMIREQKNLSTNPNMTEVNGWTSHQEKSSAAILSQSDEPWTEAIPGEILRVRIHSRDVGGRYAMLESISQPMAGAPLHAHVEDEVFHVLNGVLTFEIGSKRLEAGPGSIIVVPAGTVHAWRNFGNKPARCMVTFTPGGIEELFLRLKDTPPEGLATLAARYGSIITGPILEP